MKRKTPHNANSSSTGDTEGSEQAKASLCKTSWNKVQGKQRARSVPRHRGAGQRSGSGSKTLNGSKWSLVGTFAVSKQVPRCNMVRPRDAAKQSSSSAYERAIAGHGTKQRLMAKSTFQYFCCEISREGQRDTEFGQEVGVTSPGHLKEPPLFQQQSSWLSPWAAATSLHWVFRNKMKMYQQQSSRSQEILTPTTVSVLIIPDSKQRQKIKSSCSATTGVCHTFTARKPRALRSRREPRAIGSSLSHLPSPQPQGHLPFFNSSGDFEVLQH